jgi:hypothetical protein
VLKKRKKKKEKRKKKKEKRKKKKESLMVIGDAIVPQPSSYLERLQKKTKACRIY